MVIYGNYRCSIKMDAEFLHHIHLPKVDGGLSFKVSTHIFKSTILGGIVTVLEWNAAVIIFT